MTETQYSHYLRSFRLLEQQRGIDMTDALQQIYEKRLETIREQSLSLAEEITAGNRALMQFESFTGRPPDPAPPVPF